MGTNYYWRYDECHCCERYEEKHIGKRSGGWEFNFRGYRADSSDPDNASENIVSWADWKARLTRSGGIVDEYGHRIPLAEFIELVEKEAAPGATRLTSAGPQLLLNHIDEVLRNPQYEVSWPSYRDPRQHWKDADGYAFSAGEFS